MPTTFQIDAVLRISRLSLSSSLQLRTLCNDAYIVLQFSTFLRCFLMKISVGFPQTWGKFNCIVSEIATEIWGWGVQTFSFLNIAFRGATGLLE